MAILVLQTDTGATPAPQWLRVVLDGVTWTIGLRWNGRGGFWALTVADESGAVLADSVAVRNAGLPLCVQLRGLAGQLPGSLVALASVSPDVDAGQSELGDRVKLVYLEAADADAAGAAALAA